MSALNRILLLINLLNSRRYVTLETMKTTCGIPERSVYRYLNTLSEANIPVYYDRDLHAYRLSSTCSHLLGGLQINDALILTVALKTLSLKVNGDYRRDVEELVQTVVVAQTFPVEEIIGAFEHQLQAVTTDGDLSDLISSVLINGAIVCDRNVRVTTKTRGPSQEDVDIEHPSLRFQKSWRLVGQHNSRPIRTPVSDIKRVTIL